MVLYGVDLSHYQSGFNFTKAAAEGVQFCIGKISQGSSYRDTQWPKTHAQAKAAGLILVGYHFLDTSSPTAQANTCASWIGDMSIPVALDWEAGGGNWSNFMAVLAAFRRTGLNVRLGYCPRWYWQQQGSPNMSSAGIPLWSSRYPSTRAGSPMSLYEAVPASYWSGYGGLEVGLLQFSDHASIAGMAVDCSAFQGSREELLTLLGLSPKEGDDMTDDDRAMLTEVRDLLRWVWAQFAGDGAAPFEFTGWPPAQGGTPGSRTLVDWCRQNDVSLQEVLSKLGAQA